MELKGNVILFLNRRCTVGCASCNAAAYPGNPVELTPSWLASFFNRLHELTFPGYITWTGGEPFLSIETLKKGVSLASQNKYHSEILTAGAWFTQKPEHLETLAALGKFSLRISLDAEHQDAIPITTIINLIKKALDLNIEVDFTLREIPGRQEQVSRSLAEIKTQLPEFYRHNHHRSRWLHYLPHMPVTAGTGCLPTDNTSGSRKQKWQQPCQMGFTDLIIGEDGLGYPCCGLFGAPGHERLSTGDPLKESWENLETRQHHHPLFQALKKKGPYGICRELKLTPETWNWPTYTTPCHLCLALFHLYGEQVLEYYLNKKYPPS